MAPTRVVVTGLGVTSPVGGDVPSTWESLLAGRSGVRALTEDWAADLPVRIAGRVAVEPTEVLERVKARRLDRSSQLAMVAATQAWADAGLQGTADEGGLDGDRVGVAFASGIGGVTTLLSNYDTMLEKGPRRVSPLAVPMLMPNAPAATISLMVGARAFASTPVSACASGNEAIALGLDQLRLGRADVVVVDGMQGGTAATQEVFIEHVGIPTLAAIPQAVQALQELGVHRHADGVQLVVSGGIRTGADVAKAMALGADAVAIGTAALVALGDNAPRWADDYAALGTAPGYWDDYQDGTDPAGICTQDDTLAARLDPVEGGRRVANYLRVLTMEAQTIARACGKAHVRHLEPEDLVALTVESAAMARVPLAGTSWIPGAGIASGAPGGW